MRRIAQLGWNDLRLTLSDPPALIWLLVLPLAMTWFFSLSGGDQSGTPRIGIDIVDRDSGWLAEALIDELDARGIVLRRVDDVGDPEPGPRRLVIPEGFTSGVLAGAPQTVRLENRSGRGEAFSHAVRGSVERAIARTLERVAALDPGPVSRERFQRLPETESPVRLAVTVAGAGTPVPSGAAQSVPGMLTFLVLMMTLIYGAVFLTIEKRTGMLRRQAVLPLGRMRILLGKLLGRLYIAGLQIFVLVAAGRFLFGISWGRSPLGLATMPASYAVAVAALATLLGAVLRTSEQASAVGWIVSMILAAFGGCWWPSEVMPGWIRSAAVVLPTTWAMKGFHTLISFGGGVEAVWPSAAVLLLFGVVFAGLGARWLRFEA